MLCVALCNKRPAPYARCKGDRPREDSGSWVCTGRLFKRIRTKAYATQFQNFYTTTVDAFTVYGSGEMSIIQGPDTENDVSTTHSSALNANFLFYYDCYTWPLTGDYWHTTVLKITKFGSRKFTRKSFNFAGKTRTVSFTYDINKIHDTHLLDCADKWCIINVKKHHETMLVWSILPLASNVDMPSVKPLWRRQHDSYTSTLSDAPTPAVLYAQYILIKHLIANGVS